MFRSILLASLLCTISLFQNLLAQEAKSDVKGRWDLVVEKDGEQLPSWLEVTKSGSKTLIGRFVYAFGSARPIAEIKMKEGKYSFSIPPQWEQGDRNMDFEFMKVGSALKGTMVYTDGKTYNWTATRQPKMTYKTNPKWGTPIDLFNKKDMSGWHTEGDNQWIVEGGILKNPKAGSNLITDQKFTDFKLHAEFRYTEGSNSGIYLRGRYEVQIEDGYGMEPSSILFGGVYGFLTPNVMAANKANEWQTYDITLIGNRVSIVANGKAIINDQIIPGITGGALDSNEGDPGALFIQGDHGPVEFRSFVVTPVLK